MSKKTTGPKPKPIREKKVPMGISLPPWFVELMDDLPGSRPVEIMAAMCEVHGWTMGGVNTDTVCEWVDVGPWYDTSCKLVFKDEIYFMADEAEDVKFCPGCGKRIRVKEL